MDRHIPKYWWQCIGQITVGEHQVHQDDQVSVSRIFCVGDGGRRDTLALTKKERERNLFFLCLYF
jgi:hypothetical protein